MKKIVNLIFIIILLFASNNCLAQEESIDTDRPDQSDGVYTVPKKSLQFENGIHAAKKTLLNNFMLRYGVTTSTEVRLLADAGREVEASGLKPVTLSAKQRILQQHKVIPAITFVGYVSFEKLASKDFQEAQSPYELKLAFENKLNNKFTIVYNAGISDEFGALNLTMNLSYAPTDKVSTFVEYFSTIRKANTERSIDAGILFAPKPQLQFDISCGGSIAGAGERFFAGLGVAYIFR